MFAYSPLAYSQHTTFSNVPYIYIFLKIHSVVIAGKFKKAYITDHYLTYLYYLQDEYMQFVLQ